MIQFLPGSNSLNMPIADLCNSQINFLKKIFWQKITVIGKVVDKVSKIPNDAELFQSLLFLEARNGQLFL